MLNTKQAGNITEVECMLSFLRLGYNVLQPYGDCERYDFVVDIKGKFYKIQCKSSKLDKQGDTFTFSCRSSHRVHGKCKNEHYSKEYCDFFATTCLGKCYLVPQSECGSYKRLRLCSAKKLDANIKLASNYELSKIIEQM